MLYVPVIHTKPAEMKLGKVANLLNDRRLKPYLRLMYDNDYSNPGSIIDSLGLELTIPFIGIPRITNLNSIKASKSELIKAKNGNEDSYYSAEIDLLARCDNAIVVYDCNSKDESMYELFVEECHKKKKRCAIYTDHEIDVSCLDENDYLLFNVGQSSYSFEEILYNIQQASKVKVIMVGENRNISITNKSLEENADISSKEQIIHGDLFEEIKANNYQVYGFGDFAGWKNTVNVVGGGRSKDIIKTIVLYRRDLSLFHVVKDIPHGRIKENIETYLKSFDSSDVLGTVALMKKTINKGGPAEFNALSICHYIKQMLVHDDWSMN